MYLNFVFVFFTMFLKNRNIITKIKSSKVTDYAALTVHARARACVRVREGGREGGGRMRGWLADWLAGWVGE